MHGPLAIAGLMLLLALLGGSWTFVREPRSRALDARLDALMQDTALGLSGELRSIRVRPRRRYGFGALLEKFLKLRPDIPEVNPLPWPLVLVIGAVAGAVASFGLRFIASQAVALLGGVFVALYAAREIYQWQAERFARALFEQLPDAIELLVSAVSAGLPVTAALRHVAIAAPSPSREQFAKAIAEIEIGRPIDAALAQVHERSGVVEYAILAMTVGLQAEGGGRVSESFENLARIIRERVTVKKRAIARASEARLGGWVLAILPVFFALAISVVKPGYLHPFVVEPAARRLLGIGVILLLIGIVTMRAIIRWSVNE